MKRMFALLLTAVMLASVFAVPCFANDCIKLMLATPGISVEQAKVGVKPEALKSAIEAGQELIPQGCKLDPERITVMQTGVLTCDAEDGVGTFKVWSTKNRTIGLFFQEQGSDEWTLLQCNLGDYIESEFHCSGTYVIAVGW